MRCLDRVGLGRDLHVEHAAAIAEGVPPHCNSFDWMLRAQGTEAATIADGTSPLTVNIEPSPSFCPDGMILPTRVATWPEVEAQVALALGLQSVVLVVFDEEFDEWFQPTTLEAFDFEQIAQVRVASATYM